MSGWTARAAAAWDVFVNGEQENNTTTYRSTNGNSARQSRLFRDSKTAIMAPIITRIAIDVSSITLRHVRLNEDRKYVEDINSQLQKRLTNMANIDQTGRAFLQDTAHTLLEEGAAVMVPVKTKGSPIRSSSYEILDLRTGVVVEWYSQHVRISLYNEEFSERRDITLPKSFVGIANNPLYSIINETNSTLRRLTDKLALLDHTDSKATSPKLDMILQVPYAIRHDRQVRMANARRQSVVDQLENSKYGIAYIDGAEKITQLNRPVENNLLEQVENLEESLYNQLGLTPNVLNGTASEEEKTSYHIRTILPISFAISEAMTNAFLTKTAIAQGQIIVGVPNLFKMAPLSVMVEAVDKFTRAKVIAPNEFRAELYLKQSKDPEADKLSNPNISEKSSKRLEDTKNKDEEVS